MKMTPISVEEVYEELKRFEVNEKIYIKSVDLLIKKYIKENIDVSILKTKLDDIYIHHIYFSVNLKRIKNPDDRLDFIDNNLYFYHWEDTDLIIRYVRDCDFNRMLSLAKKYIKNKNPFIRRFGYVMFINKSRDLKLTKTKQILKLIKKDKEYYVYMAEAWLLAEISIKYPQEVASILINKDLNRPLISKTISKINESYRIDEKTKQMFIDIRDKK